MNKKTLLSILFAALAFTGLSAQNFIVEYTFPAEATQIQFVGSTTGTVDYTWSTSPSGNSGSGSFSQTNVFGIITLAGIAIEAGDVVTLSMEPEHLSWFATFANYNEDELTDVRQWGAVHWTSMWGTFQGCANLETFSATDIPDLSGVENMTGMFENATSFNGDVSAWDVSSVKDMWHMFYRAQSFNRDISSWNVSSVTDMNAMFYNASAFNQDLSAWDVSSVTDMSGMFNLATSFNQDLGAWDVSSVTDMSDMFRSATSFNQDPGNWDVAAVTDMSDMFNRAESFNRDLGGWDLNPDVNIRGMLTLSGLDCSSYSSTLIGWQANNPEVTGVIFNAAGLQYGTNAEAARAALINNQGWFIFGDLPSGTVCGPSVSGTVTATSAQEETGTHIFPNSVQTSVTVRSDIEQSIEITGMDGRPVMQLDVEKGDTQFDLSGLKPGLYFFKTSAGEVVRVLKK